MWEVSTAKRPQVQDHSGQMPPIPALETFSAEQPPEPETQPALDAFAEAGLKPSKFRVSLTVSESHMIERQPSRNGCQSSRQALWSGW